MINAIETIALATHAITC